MPRQLRIEYPGVNYCVKSEERPLNDPLMRYFTRKIRAIAVVFFALTVCPFSPAATNTVSREIRYENGDVWVEDKVHLTLGIWKTRPVLQGILKAKESGKTNLMDGLKNLLKGEDLEVVRYQTEVKDEFMDLHIRSKVKSDFQKPARLRGLANYGGYKYTLTSSGETSEPYMLVFAGNGGHLLWLPEWDPPADLAKTVVESINVTYAMRQWLKIEPTDVLSLRCFIKTGEKEETLFEASPWKEVPNAPDSEFLSRLHRSHKMSGNDWNRIFTDFKLGKSGYYVIDVSGFTNRPPIPTQGEIEDTKRAIAPSAP